MLNLRCLWHQKVVGYRYRAQEIGLDWKFKFGDHHRGWAGTRWPREKVPLEESKDGSWGKRALRPCVTLGRHSSACSPRANDRSRKPYNSLRSSLTHRKATVARCGNKGGEQGTRSGLLSLRSSLSLSHRPDLRMRRGWNHSGVKEWNWGTHLDALRLVFLNAVYWLLVPLYPPQHPVGVCIRVIVTVYVNICSHTCFTH